MFSNEAKINIKTGQIKRLEMVEKLFREATSLSKRSPKPIA
jgi:hypothetical protein